MLLVHIMYAYRGRKYRNKMQVYFCNIFQAFSFKMTLQKSNSHKESLHSANCTMFLKLSATKNCKNERVTVLRHFYMVSFKLTVENKTGENQRVSDKTYKVVNLINRCASIISMDLSMDIHIHGKPDDYSQRSVWTNQNSHFAVCD